MADIAEAAPAPLKDSATASPADRSSWAGMTCCIVGVLILMVVGRVRRAFGGAETPTLFAPVARRPAPGQTLAAPVITAAISGPDSVAVFRYAALGTAAALIAGPLLVWAGLMENTGSPAMWLVRSACYLALIVVALMLSRVVPFWRSARGVGWLLIVAGAVVFETGVLDMHLFGIIHAEHGNHLGDLAFHNVGPALMLIGAGLLGAGALGYGAAGRRKTSRRSSRSTVSSTRPSSSAVTASSNPPVTR